MKALVAKIVGAATGSTHAAQLQQVARPTLGGAETTISVSGATAGITLDASAGSVFVMASPATTFTSLTISNPPASSSCLLTFYVVQNATPRTIPDPTGAVWFGTKPTATASKTQRFNFHTMDGGTTWFCSGENVA